jgi:exopolysaccharide biosynthesis WecB/TagA/CpsF family protein
LGFIEQNLDVASAKPLRRRAALDPHAMASWPTVNLGGLPVTIAGREAVARGFVSHVLAHRESIQRPFYSTSSNGEVIALWSRNPEIYRDFQQADHILADGMPMVFYSRYFTDTPLPERIATTDLIHDVAKLCVPEGLSFYFLGATERVNERAVEAMERLHPGLVFAGRRNGYFRPDEEADLVDEINASRADILWVGMGVPLEQRFILRNLDRLTNISVVKTCGGLFDFLSGDRPRAPYWMQATGFEWAFRAWQEPLRLGPRYIRTNGTALWQLFVNSR